jgi:hypothetical protein
VCTDNLRSGIVMMKSAQDGARPDYTDPLNRARNGRILIQGQVRPRLTIVEGVRPPSLDHVLGDARLCDFKPERGQFAVIRG